MMSLARILFLSERNLLGHIQDRCISVGLSYIEIGVYL